MSSSENTRGALLMSLAMAAFVCNDALTKSVSTELGAAQIMLLRGGMTMLLVYGVARYSGVSLSFKVLRHPPVLIRTVLDVVATLTFLWALARLEFSTMSAILQSVPLIVTLGAALFLGEQVGWRRWSAIGVGLMGVLIIIRPGTENFSSAALVAIASTILTSVRDLFTRRMHVGVPTLVVTFFTCMANALLGAIILVPTGGWHEVSMQSLLQLMLASLLIFGGYQTIIQSMRAGEISFVAPFRYTGLLWGLMLGILVFAEVPDAVTLGGAAIVIASGIYSFYRERKRRGAVLSAARVHPEVK